MFSDTVLQTLFAGTSPSEIIPSYLQLVLKLISALNPDPTDPDNPYPIDPNNDARSCLGVIATLVSTESSAYRHAAKTLNRLVDRGN